MAYFKLKRKPPSPEQQFQIIRREVQDALEVVSDRHVAERRAVTSSWNHEPKFKGVVSVGPQRAFVRVTIQNAKEPLSSRYGGTVRDLWKWHNEGTGIHGPRKRAYSIFPRFKKALRFMVGGAIVIVRYVFNPQKRTHPGREGTGDVARINKELRPLLKAQIDKGLRTAFRKIRKLR